MPLFCLAFGAYRLLAGRLALGTSCRLSGHRTVGRSVHLEGRSFRFVNRIGLGGGL